MSATILNVNVLCDSLGIDRSEIATYRMKNRFPVENRPIFYEPVAKLTGGKSGMHEWSDKLVKKVDEIVKKYPDEKGIIHTHNYNISSLLLKNCQTSGRFVFQNNFKTKNEMLEYHANSHNKVIIAPAMHEGLDLKDDLSRFQIICKVPYANFYDDLQLKRRKELDEDYYAWITALKLVQSYGRSVRSETDWAHTYIIDGCFTTFRQMSSKMLPKWLLEAIID